MSDRLCFVAERLPVPSGMSNFAEAYKKSMNLQIQQTQRLAGKIQAPPSKSYTHRAVIIGSLNGNVSVINPLFCDDTLNTITLLEALGAKIERLDDRLVIQGVNGRPSVTRSGSLEVGESGTLLRFALPVAALNDGHCTVDGTGSLLKRPNREIVEALRQCGVDIAGQSQEHMLPIQVNAAGSLKGGEVFMDGGRGSQAVSALLIAASFAEDDIKLVMERKLVSRPYVDVTIDVLHWAGINVEITEDEGRECFYVKHGQKMLPKTDFTVHGDYSSAAFVLAAAILLDSDVTITDLADDCQGDRKILDILKTMGARPECAKNTVAIRGPHELHGVEIDCGNTPDLVPVLTVLGCFAEGETRIRNITHLAYKESNRVSEPAEQLKNLGADISYTNDEIRIKHSRLNAGSVSSCGDHRVAMALAVAGLRIRGGLTVQGSECISKSYPNFVSDMQGLGADMGED